MKFGGSSVANKTQIEKVRGIVASRRERNPVIVSSAHKGVTDALIGSARRAAAGEYDPDSVIDKQKGIMKELGCPEDLLDSFFEEIRTLLRGINLVRELSPRSLDYISSFGERMSTRCIADYFSRNGVKARAHDVFELGFLTDDNFGTARPLDGWEDEARKAFAELPEDEVPIVTGFIGKNRAGEITTVGRNGSDLTATLLAAALGADEVQIWSDTDGVLSADPSVVPSARNIPAMRFDEAAELAYFGSRVLHPSTLLPAMRNKVPVRVLNTNRPEHRGTVITEHAEPDADSVVTSIAYKEGQIAVTLSSTKMFGQAGFLARAFGILGEHGVVVDMISTSEVSVSFTTDDRGRLDAALPALWELGEVRVAPNKTILVIVGRQLPERPGIGAEILRAMSDAAVNVEMMSYGVGSINFSMLIADADIAKAVPLLHGVMFEAD